MRLSILASFVVVLSSLAGCAASQGEDSNANNAAFTNGAGTSCGARYADALVHYKNAVAGATDRAANRICEASAAGDSGTLSNIAYESYAAVETCAEFRNTIATSPYAAPIREALSANLELPLLTGALTESPTWSGLAAALPGKTVLGPIADVSGLSVSKLVFSDDGKATHSTPSHDAVDMTGPAPGRNGTWTVDPASGVVTVTVDGKAATYATRFDKTRDSFGLVLGSTNGATDDYFSIVSECGGS